jgi:hypothetical protein
MAGLPIDSISKNVSVSSTLISASPAGAVIATVLRKQTQSATKQVFVKGDILDLMVPSLGIDSRLQRFLFPWVLGNVTQDIRVVNTWGI